MPDMPHGDGKPKAPRPSRDQRRRDIMADFQACLMSDAAEWNMMLAGELHHKPEDRLAIIEHQCQHVRKQLAKVAGGEGA